MDACELCYGYEDLDCKYRCKYCYLGNPCIGCADYDIENDTCTSEGACGDPANKWGEKRTRREGKAAKNRQVIAT